MKYTILGFLQKQLVDLDLDEKDALILRYFIDFKDSGNMKVRIINGKPYYWLKYSSLLENLPILKISNNDVLRRRFKKLIKAKVLEYEVVKENGTYTFFTVGQNYINLIDGEKSIKNISTECCNDSNNESDETTLSSKADDLKVETMLTLEYGQPNLKVGPKDSSNNNSSIKHSICGLKEPCEVVKTTYTEKTPYESIINLFNNLCVDLPCVKVRNSSRDKKIKSMFKNLGMKKVKEVFERVQDSDYLSGRNQKWLNCCFDWVIKESNYIKILEGNYNRNFTKKDDGKLPSNNNIPFEESENVEFKINLDDLGEL